MGTSASAAQLAAKMGQAARSLEYSTLDGVREAGVLGKAIFIESLPTRKMSNVGRSGAKLGARYTVPKSRENPMTIVSYTGPVPMLNTGTRRHLIGPKGWRSGRGKGRLKFTGGDGGIRSGAVEHPGVKGKKFASNAQRRVIAAAPRQIELATARALRKVF